MTIPNTTWSSTTGLCSGQIAVPQVEDRHPGDPADRGQSGHHIGDETQADQQHRDHVEGTTTTRVPILLVLGRQVHRAPRRHHVHPGGGGRVHRPEDRRPRDVRRADVHVFQRRDVQAPATVTDSFHDRVTRYGYNNANISSVTRLDGTPGAVTDAYLWETGTSVLKTGTDPLTHANNYDHDMEGCRTKVTDASSRVTDLARTAFGAPSWFQTYPNGVAQPAAKTSFNYVRGDLSRVTVDAGPMSDPHSSTRATTVFVDNAGGWSGWNATSPVTRPRRSMTG